MPAPAEFPCLKGLRLLVVDDDADTRELFAIALQENGADVTVAGSVREALRILERLEPDIVLSNIVMPNEDGYDLIRQVRSRDAQQGRQTLAIAITGMAREEDRDRILAAGFQHYLSKPISLSELLGLVFTLAHCDG